MLFQRSIQPLKAFFKENIFCVTVPLRSFWGGQHAYTQTEIPVSRLNPSKGQFSEKKECHPLREGFNKKSFYPHLVGKGGGGGAEGGK